MDERGVTVIELVIVIGIIAISALLTVPLITEDKLDGATRIIYSDLQYARMQAIAKKNNFRVLFLDTTGCHTFDGYTYNIHDDANNDGVCDTGELTTKDISNYNGVTFTADANPTFNPTGTMNAGTVTLTKSSDTKSIIFSWTGRIRLQ
jgi:Tfp pilus assembly protein FimT